MPGEFSNVVVDRSTCDSVYQQQVQQQLKSNFSVDISKSVTQGVNVDSTSFLFYPPDQYDSSAYFGNEPDAQMNQKALFKASALNNLSNSMSQCCIRSDINAGSRNGSQSPLCDSKIEKMYFDEAVRNGFIVGEDLDRVRANSHRGVVQAIGRISNTFKHKYGESDSKTKKTYLQIGVRVPSKDHVSEIVGKQGSKIKQIREKSGALVTTPGENEDHVFIIEAPPDTALMVGKVIQERAAEISYNRCHDRRRGSTGSTCSSIGNGVRLSLSSSSSQPSRTSSMLGARNILACGKISIPQEVVGKIIGTQGSIITTIQRDTGTEIKSPPREPGRQRSSTAYFEIIVYQTTSLTCPSEAQDRVNKAKQLIAHMVIRQLERLYQEDAEFASSLNSTGYNNGNHESNMWTNNYIGSSCEAINQAKVPIKWMWPDVAKLDENIANEVVDRILQESKNKTKRSPTMPTVTSAVPANDIFSEGNIGKFMEHLATNSRSSPEKDVLAYSGFLNSSTTRTASNFSDVSSSFRNSSKRMDFSSKSADSVIGVSNSFLYGNDKVTAISDLYMQADNSKCYAPWFFNGNSLNGNSGTNNRQWLNTSSPKRNSSASQHPTAGFANVAINDNNSLAWNSCSEQFVSNSQILFNKFVPAASASSFCETQHQQHNCGTIGDGRRKDFSH